MKENEKKYWYAWTAGIIDGEGSIGIIRQNSGNTKGEFRYSPYVCVRNTEKAMIDKLSELWGGEVKLRKSKKGKAKDCWAWFLSLKKFLDFSEKVSPFLTIKRKQIEIAKELQIRKEKRIGTIMVPRLKHKSLWITEKEREYRRLLREKIHLLNRPGRFAWAS